MKQMSDWHLQTFTVQGVVVVVCQYVTWQKKE
jgi:hypothetical protein